MLRGLSGSHEAGYWPSYELLREIHDDVRELAEQGRVRQIFPIWKAFLQVDRRLKKLRLKLHVEGLITRARAMLPPAESEADKVVRLLKAGNAQAQCSLRDMATKPQKLDKLLQEDRQVEIQWRMALPLAEWIVGIGHPMAKDFVYIAGFDPPDREFRRRIFQSARVRRHRSKKHLQKALQPSS